MVVLLHLWVSCRWMWGEWMCLSRRLFCGVFQKGLFRLECKSESSSLCTPCREVWWHSGTARSNEDWSLARFGVQETRVSFLSVFHAASCWGKFYAGRYFSLWSGIVPKFLTWILDECSIVCKFSRFASCFFLRQDSRSVRCLQLL